MIIKNMGFPKFQNNRHEVIANTKDIKKAFEQIVLWGEASWWPDKCTMKFMRLGGSNIQKGTVYRQKVLLPFTPSWLALVTEIIDNKSISRRFLDGLLDGEEKVSIFDYQGSLRVEYLMNYRIKGFMNNILWKTCFNRMHDSNIRLILKNLKDYLEQ